MARGVQQLIELAYEMQKLASRYQAPEGAMELIDAEYAKLPDLMLALAGVWKAFHARATDPKDGHPLHPAVMAALEELQKVEIRGADAAAQITPMARRLEQARINALRDPRMRMWDWRANRGRL